MPSGIMGATLAQNRLMPSPYGVPQFKGSGGGMGQWLGGDPSIFGWGHSPSPSPVFPSPATMPTPTAPTSFGANLPSNFANLNGRSFADWGGMGNMPQYLQDLAHTSNMTSMMPAPANSPWAGGWMPDTSNAPRGMPFEPSWMNGGSFPMNRGGIPAVKGGGFRGMYSNPFMR